MIVARVGTSGPLAATISNTAPVSVSNVSTGCPGRSKRSTALARLLFATSKLPLQSVFT